MQSCIERAVALCKGQRLDNSTNSDASCVMDKESMSQEIGNMDKEPPLKKARYSHPDGLDGAEMKSSSPVVGSSEMCVKPIMAVENVAHAERFTGKTNDILTCEDRDLKSKISENSELPFVPKDTTSSNDPDQCNHLEFNSHSKPRTLQIHHVHPSDSSVLVARTRTTEDSEVSEGDDDASDASKLVLSVIKTKVDIQTMKMCLQHTAESSYRPSTLVNAVASSITGASTGTTPASPPSLRGPQRASFATAASSSGNPRPVDDAEFSLAELEAIGHDGENLCHCDDMTCFVCCRKVENINPDPAARSTARLAHWQDQHTAKAIVDNAINRTIEEMVIAPDQAVPAESAVYEVDRIQCHGLVTTAQQSVHHLQQRLQPMINQLTQASDLVFARNIEQSRDDLVGRGSIPSSPGVDNV